MISSSELLLLKGRLLTAATAARKIASSPDPVLYDEEQYEAVYTALMSIDQDLRRVLAELDVLRGMFYSGVSLFLSEEMKSNGNGVPGTGGDVGAVQVEADRGGSPAEPPVGEGADGGVPESRPVRKRTKRSKPRRDPAGNGVLPEPVGSGDRAGQVDRG